MSFELPGGKTGEKEVSGPSVVPYGPRVVRAKVQDLHRDHEMLVSPLECEWRGRTVIYTPSAVELSLFHTVDLIHRGMMPWLFGLKMTEHFAALSQLTATEIKLVFKDNETPYSMEAGAQLCEFILKKRRRVIANNHVTVEETWRFAEDGQAIVIEPHSKPELIITGEFDFSEHPHLHWIEKQEATLNTGTENNEAELLSFARARSPVADIRNKCLLQLLKKLGRDAVESCVLRGPEKMQENEVAKHKLLDFLALLNLDFFGSGLPPSLHPYFLAARISIIKLGHEQGIVGMRQFSREIADGQVNIRQIG